MPKPKLLKDKKGTKAAIIVVFAAVLTTIFLMLAILLMPTAAIPTFEITDRNGSWEAQGTIAVFDDKIKPGSEGEYPFILKSDSEGALRYGINLAEYLHNINQEAHPFMQYRLKMNGVLLDESAEWRYASEMDYYDIIILPGTEHIMTLEWRWDFDADDENDTLIGVTGGKLSIVCFVWAEVIEE